jgi:hypothetical protein
LGGNDGATTEPILIGRALPNAKHKAVSCEANRSRSVIALGDMSTFAVASLGAMAHG